MAQSILKCLLSLGAFVGLIFAVETPVFADDFGAMSPGANSSVVSETTGVISYTALSDGSFRGEEHWRILTHPDGSKTAIMTVRLDATEVSRTVTLRVDKTLKPIDAHQVLWTEGKFRGSAFYWVENGMMNAVMNSENGVLRQSVAVPEQFSWVTHPLGTDAFHMWYFDPNGPAVQPATVYNTDTLGKTLGSIMGRVQTVDLEYLGQETVTVPAGTFATEKYRLANTMEIWTEPARNLMVRMRVEAQDRLYELKALQQTELGSSAD